MARSGISLSPVDPGVVLQPELVEGQQHGGSVAGIGQARATQLGQMGIDSVAKLAAARPDEIDGLRGVSREMAIGFIRAAQRLV